MKVWGVISQNGVGPLVRYSNTMTGDKYLEVLDTYLIASFPFLRGSQTRASKYYFQQDNAGPHRDSRVEEWFKAKKIKELDWPAYSPDLSLIENVWDFMKGELYKKNSQLETADQTWLEIKYIWKHRVGSMLKKLYDSMNNRIEEVIKREGKRINY